MNRWNASLWLILVGCGVGLAGCSSKAALPAKKVPRSAPEATAPGRQAERAAKTATRESAFAMYSNPEYGVAFRYPRSFALAETGNSEGGAPEDGSGVRSQQELETEESGAVLVATVVVPNDAYPNTTFAGGSAQFAVNRYLTAGSCRQSLLSRLGDSNGKSGTATIQGVEFAWIDSDQGDASAEFFERDYAGFTNGVCYEFFVRVGVEAVAADSDVERPPDEKRILGHLEKIVASLQFEPKAVSALDGPPSGKAVIRKR
jgi:hypothetical protein